MTAMTCRFIPGVALLFVLQACQSRSEAREARGEVVQTGIADARAIASDSVLSAAEAAIHAGHPWRATVLLAPVLADHERRSPAALILAARAAAGWSGWAEVSRLLASEDWLDAKFAGEGRELFARSALERGNDSAAVTYASAAVLVAADAHAKAVRLTLLARALDRRDQRDSARASYQRAAESLPGARDWLLLRAAGVTADSDQRVRDYAAVTHPAARARIPWTEAEALERSGNALAAAARFAALGATVSAMRLRLAATSDSAERHAVLVTLLAFIQGRASAPDVHQAIEVVDHAFPALTPAQELAIARGAASSGQTARAVAGFQRADAANQLTPADRLQYGATLGRAVRWRDAIAEFDKIDAASPLGAQAAYQHARALLSSGQGAAARTALREVVTRFSADSSAGPAAAYLLADLSTDDGKDADARALFQQLYHAYPSSARAADARFRAALIGFTAGDAKGAAVALDSLVVLHPGGEEAQAARYWGGRAWAARGDSAAAKLRWREAAAKDPSSYYAAASARRLGVQPWVPAAAEDAFPHVAAVDSAMQRIALLEALGMDVEAHLESEALEAEADRSPSRLLATASAFRDGGQPARAIQLGRKAVGRGMHDASTYRLVYPVVHREELAQDARARSLDPALVAGIIRQESSFNPRAVSPAGARGLMQVMPTVGAQIARSLSYPVWDGALLFDPDANLQLGTTHLASFFKQYEGTERVLAAYNAGGSRATRWSAKNGVDDPEVFVERIPFAETRDYVRIVTRNAELYRALYAW